MTTTNQADRSVTQGIISEPADVHADDVPTAATKQSENSKSRRRNPARIAAAKVMSALRGDKYMVDAYPAAGREDAAAVGDDEANAKER
jgi:hypothetical protein